MGVLRGIGRASPLVAAGAAAWYMRRRAQEQGAASVATAGFAPSEPAPHGPAAPADRPSAHDPPAVPEPPPPVEVPGEDAGHGEEDTVEIVALAAQDAPGRFTRSSAPDAEDAEAHELMTAHAGAVEEVSDAVDVVSVVEDLLAVAPHEELVIDAEAVEEPPGRGRG